MFSLLRISFSYLCNVDSKTIPESKILSVHMTFLKTKNNIISHRDYYIYVLDQFRFFFVNRLSHFCDFQSSLMLIRFFCFSTRLHVENASFVNSYLGQKYVYRKQIVKHISNLDFSNHKNSRPAVTCQPGFRRENS